VVRNRNTAAEATQEAFAAAWQQIATLRQPESFGGWLLRIARNKALNRLDRERRSRPLGDDEALAVLDGERRTGDDPAGEVTGSERDDLVWAASAALGEADVSLLSLHLRHGLDAGELADELGVAPNAAHQRLFRLRKRLGDAIAAWTVWQRGSPRCGTLRQLLDAAGMTRFDRDASSLISVHVDSCPDCRSRQAVALSPEALFAATPFVLAGPMLKAQAAAALSAEGVPMSPPSPSPPGESGGGGSARTAPRLVAAGVAVLAVVVTLAVLASRRDEEPVAARPIETDEPQDTTSTSSRSASSSSTTVAPTSTGPLPTSPSGAPGPTDPPIVVPEPGPTTTVTSTTTTTEPSAPEPVIGGFRATQASAPSCPGGRIRITFVWESTHATSALLGPSGDIAEAVETSGTRSKCAAVDSTWTLQVTGPGGTEKAQVTVP
jgi:RNA polymerase sigma factor (sigma-70 family)